jgi:hypothetical protein
MLRGHVFKFQTFANEAFAHFINTFLQGNMGVTKGCNLSKTNNSVTISAGYFCVMGRFLEIVGNETISDISNTGYYQLICEIDLSKTNTSSELNQAVIKLIRNTSGYSNLTKEDLFNGGSLYQYEFARFKVTETGITEFTDRRTFLNLASLYSQINSNFNTLFNAKDEEAESLLEEIREELANIEDGSAYLLKTQAEADYLQKDDAEDIYLKKEDAQSQYMNINKISYGTSVPSNLENGQIYLQYFN